MSRVKYIPYDLIINILSRLPSKSLIRFRCVCKSWRSLITCDSDFHTLHVQNANNSNNNDIRHWVCVHSTGWFQPKYYQVFDETFSSGKLEPCPESYPKEDKRRWRYFKEVIGSCRGLVGVYHGWDESCYNIFGLWNPSTRTHKKLERLYIPEDSMADRYPMPFYYTLFGVGFSNKDNDYMVVVVARNRENNQDHRLYLYSLRDNSWSRIKDEPNSSWRNWNCPSFSRGGTYFKGTCHWTCQGDTKGKVIILCFDFGSKKIWVMNVPPKSPNYAICKSFVHKDMLAYWETDCCVQGNSEYRFWVMKEYGSSNSWTILFRVEGGIFPHSNPRLAQFGTTTNGRLVLYRSYARDSYILMAYDPQTKEFKDFQVPNIFTLVSYQENLMLL